MNTAKMAVSPAAPHTPAATPEEARGLLFARALEVILAGDFCEPPDTPTYEAPERSKSRGASGGPGHGQA